MRSLFDLASAPQLQPALIEPFNGPRREASPGAELHALGGPSAVLKAAGVTPDAWDPTADEEFVGFDIHLGVYASD